MPAQCGYKETNIQGFMVVQVSKPASNETHWLGVLLIVWLVLCESVMSKM